MAECVTRYSPSKCIGSSSQLHLSLKCTTYIVSLIIFSLFYINVTFKCDVNTEPQILTLTFKSHSCTLGKLLSCVLHNVFSSVLTCSQNSMSSLPKLKIKT
ncbi:hypothetical protein BBBOND_0200170 [Babesia bigemina]|uniref:Uncharacterized protein n=1 Tax=Babesia bigemina TaxID=5866 RepID=A0A061DAX0_BABBI|nr:hypothetical protein BBBOND_0200170 [Babesia bigemina]CDR94860.1 hypothetical protein BBBOND_0200170 [Babesia bigemina]|eukprot:XP_012767046.1 hypothetical protein BBBOND_0200170 [Babesia bigemina]